MNQTTTIHELPDLESYRFDGKNALQDILRSSVFGTTAQAVASLTKFSHPDTVAQTNNQNIFRVIRWSNKDVDDERKPLKRGDYIPYDQNGRVMLDDNTGPTDAFVWANGSVLKSLKDVQFNHIYADSRVVTLYTCLANLCVTPAFLAKLTDTDKEICALLKYRVYELYDGFKPRSEPVPVKPEGYDNLAWASLLPRVGNLEVCMRQAILTNQKNRAVCSIQELGWCFNGFKSEPIVKLT